MVTLEKIIPTQKSREELDCLIKELYDVALDAFAKWLPHEAIDARTRHATFVLVLRDNTRRAVAYAVNEELELQGKKVNYFATALFRREVQRHGLYSELNDLRASLLPADVLMTRTQNPVVYRAFNRLCADRGYRVFPQAEKTPAEVIALAKEFCNEVTESLVVPGVYFNRSLMDDTPAPKTLLEQRLWSTLSVDKGDALVVVGLK
ncbi:hypothetical protein HY639_01385 [Candidatus Woesearchaeota archaeon]|nr:hypothetical protein [Candidatus Woesearchaeota archaeon]